MRRERFAGKRYVRHAQMESGAAVDKVGGKRGIVARLAGSLISLALRRLAASDMHTVHKRCWTRHKNMLVYERTVT